MSLPDEMARIHEEAEALRHKRQTFITNLKSDVKDLQRNTTAMRADMRRSHARTATKARADLDAFASGIRETTAAMRAGFRTSHAEMGAKAKAKRRAWVYGEKAPLPEQREVELKAKEEAERKAREQAESRAKREAERKAREQAELRARQEAERKAREQAAQKPEPRPRRTRGTQ